MFKYSFFLFSLIFAQNLNALTIDIPVPPQMMCEVKELYGDENSETSDVIVITYDRSVPMNGTTPTHYFSVESIKTDYSGQFTFGYRSRGVTYFQDQNLLPDYFNKLCGNYTELSDRVFYTGSGDGGPYSCLVCI